MIMKKSVVAIILIALSFSGFSQIKFEKGYFIDNSGIKTECLIKNIDWNYNPTEFEYRTTINSDSKIKTIQTIQEFGILEQSTYKRFEVAIDRSSDKLNKLRTNKEPNYTTETLFLKVLVTGDAVLYRYAENNLTRFFYNVNGSEVQQLIYKRYKIQNSKVAQNNRFRQQLWSDVRCQTITIEKVEIMDYFKRDLERYFINYNNCKNPDFKVEVERRNLSEVLNLNIRPGIGLSTTTLERTSGAEEIIEYGSMLSLRLGVELEYILPFNKNKWSLFLEPTFKYLQVKDKEASYTPPSSFSTVRTVIADLDYNSLELPIGLRHHFFLNDKSKVFVNAALVLDFSFNSKIDVDFRSTGANNLIDLYSFDISTSTNFAFGFGYNYKDVYSIEMQYQGSRGLLNDFVTWKSSYQSFSLIFGYTLF